ncbi:MAG: VCBS repeat-containing protein, partial [Thermoplasmata archaeon]|nr:VCBS repeat-containing protein [Thermoplasmata archaeon]
GPGNRDDPRISSSMYDNIIIDINGDGYDDVVSAVSYSGRLDIFHGSASGVDGTADDSMDTDTPRKIAVGVERRERSYLMGTLVSNVINRPMDKKWDILVLEADLPANTEMSVDILDTGFQPVLGFTDLTGPDIDLSAVTIPGIHIQISLRSNDRVTTPILDRMFVKWMDKNVWRDEFYGYAKVDQVSGYTITGGQMVPDTGLVGGSEIVFANLRKDGSYQTHSLAYRDAGGMDYTSVDPLRFRIPSGASDVVVTDANKDGYNDLLFSVLQTSSTNYMADSPMFMGSPVGFDTVPTTKFGTIGARDTLVADLNKDGYMDVVFAQEQNSGDYAVNSTLFWGDDDGWNTTADVEFVTTGASGVATADIDKDGLLDLVFACYRSVASTSIDSQVYIQTSSGFDGTNPDKNVPTKGARAVAVGDVDKDGWQDLVFANSISGGFAEIDSSIFWGTTGGSFAPTPTNLPTMGAQDVMVTDLNGDNDLDIVFANYWNNGQSRDVDSYIYMGAGSRTFSGTADEMVATIGASSVTVTDLDGTGWKDLVFACQFDGATYEIGSRVFLGGSAGYGSSPDIMLPTSGASGVAVADIVPKDKAGYLSKVISPENPVDAGVFEIFRYNAANLPAGHTGTIYVLDADTGSVLATTALVAGVNEFSLADKFRIREHDAIQILITVDGLDPLGGLVIDDLWLNWSPRNQAPPSVLGVE